MTLAVPPEGITIKDRFFKTDTITQPNGQVRPIPGIRIGGSDIFGLCLCGGDEWRRS